MGRVTPPTDETSYGERIGAFGQAGRRSDAGCGRRAAPGSGHMQIADHPSGNVSDLILKLQAQRRAIAAAAAATDRILEEIAVSLLVPRPARAAAAGHAAHGAHTATGANGADGSRPKT